MDESVGALKEKYERERSMLTEDNRKLTTETDRVRTAKPVGFLFFLFNEPPAPPHTHTHDHMLPPPTPTISPKITSPPLSSMSTPASCARLWTS